MHNLYRDYSADPQPGGFYDFRIKLAATKPQFWGRKEVEFDWEGMSPFPARVRAHTHPLFEWGLNWCVATANGASAMASEPMYISPSP